jgi:hypothetical protein
MIEAEKPSRRGEHVHFPGRRRRRQQSHGEDRNRMIFGGRSGFARLTIEQIVPIVPIATAADSANCVPGLKPAPATAS